MRRALFIPFILCAALAVAQTVMVLRDGSRLEVESFEIRDALVVITALDGELQSLPLSLVDLEATRVEHSAPSKSSISRSAGGRA